jgi:cathepsin L
LIIVAALVACSVAASVPNKSWTQFKAQFGKTYATATEENLRRSIFEEKVKRIAEHNVRADLGLVTYRRGVNEFSDMTHEEFRAQRNGFKMSKSQQRGAEVKDFSKVSVSALPKTVDWRKKGVVTPVKDQAQCGSCWAFAAVASLEGQHAMKAGKLVSLSEQNLVDCSGAEGNDGCEGGLPDNAYQYIIDAQGLDTEKSYPYTAEDGQCAFNKKTVGATLTSFVDVATGDETALQKAVVKIGPISVGIDASNESFQEYSGGIYVEPECSTDQLDHGVTVVGYGTDASGADYWLVKNSWGNSWGIKGYIKMARNANNQCGIATLASYPVV